MKKVKFNRDDELIAKNPDAQHRIYLHSVFIEDPIQGSMGNMVLLKMQLLIEELSAIEKRSTRTKDVRSSEEFKQLRYSLFDENKNKNHGHIICYYCNRICNRDHMHQHQATIDHVIPLSEGGDPMNLNNLVVACRKCNKSKRSHTVEDFKRKVKKN